MSEIALSRGIFIAPVVRRRTVCLEHFELTFGIRDFPEAQPGQFLNVLCRAPEDSANCAAGGAMLRRPFSIAGLRRSGSSVEVDLMGRVVGAGTAWLDGRRAGDRVSLLGPLGRGFTAPARDERAILIAGGVGLPPIRWFAEILRKNGVLCEAILGAQTREFLPVTLNSEPSSAGAFSLCADEFARSGVAVSITTDDGSCGLRGRVTERLEPYLVEREPGVVVRAYACGPEAMLRAVARLCAAHQVRCEVAMERVMGCGMGTCQSCVVPMRDGARAGRLYALCCRDGPVFDAETVAWQG